MYKCEYCLQDKEKLETSHIIPKLIYRWIKKTGTTGRLRDGRNVRIPVQDGLKKELLCSDCEGDFSEYETYFANQIFSQMTDNDGEVDFAKINWAKFDKFILSLLWRTLYYCANESTVNKDYYPKEIEIFNQIAIKVKDAYNFNKTLPINVYFIPLNKASFKNGIITLEDYVYFERSVSVNLIVDDDNNQATTLYIKIPYAMIVCEVINCENHAWIGLKLNDREQFALSKAKIPNHVQNYINYDCNRCYDMAKDIPSHQVDKLQKIMTEKGSPDQGTVKAMMKNILRDKLS
jgi:hypothetical protein